MRKKILGSIFDKLLWFVVYSLPLIFILFYSFKFNYTETSNIVDGVGSIVTSVTSYDIYSDVFEMFGVGQDNILSNAFASFGSLVGTDLFANNGFLNYYLTYFSFVSLIHVVIDLFLMIPRLAHHYISRFSGGAE